MFRYSKITNFLQLIADIILLNVSIAIVFALYHYCRLNTPVQLRKVEYLLFNLLWIIFVLHEKLYQIPDNRVQIYFRTFKAFVYYSISIYITGFYFTQKYYIFEFIFWHLAVFFCLIFISIIPIGFIGKKLIKLKSINDKRKVAIIGIDKLSCKAATFFKKEYSGFEFLGFFDDRNIKRDTYPVLGTVADSLKYVELNKLNEIYSTILPQQNNIIRDLSLETEKKNIRVKYILDNNLIFNGKIDFEAHDDISILSYRKEPLEDISNRILKRTFDLAICMIVLVFILSWLYPLIAVLIKLTSKGPVLFIQERSGINGKIFRCYKFRTMAVNNMANSMHALKHDPRITLFGKILRKTSLDELPQFINVLKNEMSIIGPRPHMVKHTEMFCDTVNAYMVRHYIKPGITGWAQVNGCRGNATVKTMTKRVEYDIDYIENWSLFLDIEIILRTALLVFGGDKHAY